MYSIKDHPHYVRMKHVAPQEVASWVLGDTRVEDADAKDRKAAFRRVAKRIMTTRAERKKRGFTSDTNGEIARAMAWAFKEGVKAGKKSR